LGLDTAFLVRTEHFWGWILSFSVELNAADLVNFYSWKGHGLQIRAVGLKYINKNNFQIKIARAQLKTASNHCEALKNAIPFAYFFMRLLYSCK